MSSIMSSPLCDDPGGDLTVAATTQLYDGGGGERGGLLVGLTQQPKSEPIALIGDEEDEDDDDDEEEDESHEERIMTAAEVSMIPQDLAHFTVAEEQEQKLILAAAAGGAEDHVLAQQGLVDPSTLQSLLSSGQLVDSNGQPIQIIALTGAGDGEGAGNKLWQLVSTEGGESMVMALGATEGINESSVSSEEQSLLEQPPMTEAVILPPPSKNLPPGCPEWAARLRDCEKLGDFYRGWVESEVELDVLLTYHKQHTLSVWGTRQSPTPGKPSQRLMWKSQYVPFDGVPFINTGSRAVVMECQFGPRRKGMVMKKYPGEVSNIYKQTCPARIYIKRVRKFPSFRVDLTQDKKSLKTQMDKAFHSLKDIGLANPALGQDRWYVQLPTEKAHEFHTVSDNAAASSSNPSVDAATAVSTPTQHYQAAPAPPPSSSSSSSAPAAASVPPSRLNPSVVSKIRSMVAGGETRLYTIRKALRRYVEKDLFPEYTPEKHNLQYYPTVNDLQNHIHQAIKDIEAGVLPITAQTVNVEVVTNNDLGVSDQMWPGTSDRVHPETVTVTLTQKPGEDGQHVISRVETRLSDGSIKVSNGLTPETAKILSKLHPNMFPPEGLIELQQGPEHGLATGGGGGLTLLHQPVASEPGGEDGNGGALTNTGDGGVLLPSGDIHQAQNGIYTVIATENSSLLLANANTNLAASSSHQLQIESSGHITSTPALSLIASGSGSNGGLVAMSEATLAAAASGGMVVQETAEGGLMLVDAQGNTLKLEQTADGGVVAAAGGDAVAVAVDAATGGEVHDGTVEAGTVALDDAVTWTLHDVNSTVVKMETDLDDGIGPD